MRVLIEHYFRSGKHSRLLDQHQHLGIAKVRLHVAMSRLAYLATALEHLEADDYKGMRHMGVNLHRTDKVVTDGIQSPEWGSQNGMTGVHRNKPYGQRQRQTEEAKSVATGYA